MNETERLLEGMELAWGIIANAYGGDWSLAPQEWRRAAERWRDKEWHPALKRKTAAESSEVE